MAKEKNTRRCNNIPYSAFYDWFKKIQKKFVPVEVEGITEELLQAGNEEQ